MNIILFIVVILYKLPVYLWKGLPIIDPFALGFLIIRFYVNDNDLRDILRFQLFFTWYKKVSYGKDFLWYEQ